MLKTTKKNKLSRSKQRKDCSFWGYLRYPQEMAPVIVPEIKEESFLVGSDYLRNTCHSGFILAWQVSSSIHSKFWRRWLLTTMARYKSSSNIIWKSNQMFLCIRRFLFQEEERMRPRETESLVNGFSTNKEMITPDLASWKALMLHGSQPRYSWKLPILHQGSFLLEQ